eukprot:4960044-Amphidinium_carterae.1
MHTCIHLGILCEDQATAIISSPCDSAVVIPFISACDPCVAPLAPQRHCEDCGNHMDSLITKLISACQTNDVSKANCAR